MPSAVKLREDYSAGELRALAGRTKDVNQSRRLLSLAAVRDGMDRGSAARIGGMDRQTGPYNFRATKLSSRDNARAALCPKRLVARAGRSTTSLRTTVGPRVSFDRPARGLASRRPHRERRRLSRIRACRQRPRNHCCNSPPRASSTSPRPRRPTLTPIPTRNGASGSSRTSKNWRRRSTRLGTSGWSFSIRRNARSSRRTFPAPRALRARPEPGKPPVGLVIP
jgi:hypothetical protein